MSAVPHLSVVVPVYNERETLGEILRRIQGVAIDKEIVLVDDGSNDGTREELVRMSEAIDAGEEEFTLRDGDIVGVGNVRVRLQDRNRGKGAALRIAFEAARGDIVVIQDADLEYDPVDYPALLGPIEAGLADIVYGSRFLGGGAHRVLYFWHTVGNRFLTLLSNMLTNLNLSDVWTCYKAVRREALMRMRFTEDRFGFEVEITSQASKLGLRIYEVPISYHGRTYEQGKKITWRDGVKAVWQTLKHNLFR